MGDIYIQTHNLNLWFQFLMLFLGGAFCNMVHQMEQALFSVSCFQVISCTKPPLAWQSGLTNLSLIITALPAYNIYYYLYKCTDRIKYNTVNSTLLCMQLNLNIEVEQVNWFMLIFITKVLECWISGGHRTRPASPCWWDFHQTD